MLKLCSVKIMFSSVQSFSCVWLFVTPWIAVCQASMSITNSWSLLKLMSIESVIPSNHLILRSDTIQPSHPPLSPSPPAFNLSQHQVLFNKSTFHIRWPKKYCSFSFSFSIKPSNEYSGLIFFRINWFDLLAVQWTLKSLLQHHSLKGSVLQCSAFFMIQLWHPQMTTGKTIALTRWAFVSKVMSLVSNVLSRFVIAFLPRNKCL